MISADTLEASDGVIGLEWRIVARQYSGPGQMEWSYLVNDIDGLKVGMYETRSIAAVTGKVPGGYVLYAKIRSGAREGGKTGHNASMGVKAWGKR